MLQLAFLTLLVGVLLHKLSQIGKRDSRMPPGPPTLPILGNSHQIPITGFFKRSALRLYERLGRLAHVSERVG